LLPFALPPCRILPPLPTSLAGVTEALFDLPVFPGKMAARGGNNAFDGHYMNGVIDVSRNRIPVELGNN
jgi:hypothetical protein